MHYHIWTIGCQMNQADSERLARAFEARGLLPAASPDGADVVVLNTCSVRRAAEDKAISRAGTLRALKRRSPSALLALGGCMAAPDTLTELRRRLPHFDLFFRPGDFAELLDAVDAVAAEHREPSADCPIVGPSPIATGPARWLPIMNGCDRRCTYCIVPYRRGPEVSRPLAEIVGETERLVADGVREVTLLGQIVDRYGHDLPGRPDLADLLMALDAVAGLERIRFLTSHPRDFSDRIVECLATLPKVCEHVNLPIQAGDDALLRSMARGYTVDRYRDAVRRIRDRVPSVSLATDVIVGFSGESDNQFQQTLDLLAEVRFDVVHVAMYSVRPGTRAGDTMADDVPTETKKARLAAVEVLQERVATEINAALLGQTVEVLVEERDGHSGRWRGRTRTNKLVYFADSRDWLGRLAAVRLTWTGPWSLIGEVVGGEAPSDATGRISLPVI